MAITSPAAGARKGLFVAASFLAVVISVVGLLMGADKLIHPDKGSGLSLLTGFLILPLMMVAGLPWSYVALKFGQSPAVGAPLLAASVLLNGAIIGALVGAVRKRKLPTAETRD